jgi:glycosyltransferase involved in cell wall biosynthesis
MTPLRAFTIGIDARAAVEVPAGRGRVVRELLRSLAARADDGHRYILYARRAWDELELDGRFAWCTIAARDPWWHVSAARAANRACDVFLSSNSYLTVLFLRIPAVTIIYDLAAFEPAMRPNARSTIIERLTLAPAVRRSAALIAISKATADALAARYPASVSRTTVAHLGAGPEHAGELAPTEARALPAPGFVLAVGTLEPRKNLPRLVQAYRTLDAELQVRHPLVVVGTLGWKTGPTLAALGSLGERCTMLGFVSDAVLRELYGRCGVFCYPSLGEGFGLPVLEAMAAGAPVVTSNTSSLPEVGGDTVEYVDPHDVTSIAAGLRRVLVDDARRAQLSAGGPARASGFSWERFGQRTLEVLEAAGGRDAQAASSRS